MSAEQRPAKRSTTSLTITVQNDHAGAVIGPKGSTLGGIRERSGCRVAVEHIPTPDGERLVLISGPAAENVANGLDGIVEALLGASHPATMVCILVAPASVGALIGKSGAQIKQFRTDSGAEIRVNDHGSRVLQTYIRCEVSGEPQAIRVACRAVSHFLYEHYTREGAPELPDPRALLSSVNVGGMAGPIAGAPYSGPGGGYGGPGGYGFHGAGAPFPAMAMAHGAMGAMPGGSSFFASYPGGGAMGAVPAPMPVPGGRGGTPATMEMLLPKRFVGHIIGKSGKYINSVRQQYGVEIQVEDSQPFVYGPTGEDAAMLIVSGPRDNVWPACARCVQHLLVGGSAPDDGETARVETLTLDNATIPRLIGKGGSRINLIRTSSRCKISIDQPENATAGEQATITIEGRTREIIGARMMIEGKETVGADLGDAAAAIAAGSFQTTLELYLPKKYSGNIIGKSGKFINTVRGNTACDIQVNDAAGIADPLSGEELAIVTIHGPNSAIAWGAAGQMMSYLHMAKFSPEADAIQTDSIAVPAESVGQVIGKHGARINLIRHYSGCKVNIEQPPEGGGALITLEGSARQVQAARSLIQARETKIESHYPIPQSGAPMGGSLEQPDAGHDETQPYVQLPSVGLGGLIGPY